MLRSSAEATASADAPEVLRLRPRRVLGVIAVTAVGLNVANALCIVAGANTDRTRFWLVALERTPATWLSAAVLALAAAAAWAVGIGRVDAAAWRFVSLVLLVLSIDEVASFHERLAAVPGIPGVGSRGWAGAGLVLVAFVAVRLRRWAVALAPRLRSALVVGAALFVAGAVGFEVLAGNHQSVHGSDTTYWTLSTIEEDLELLGVGVVVAALLDTLARRAAPLRLVVGR